MQQCWELFRNLDVIVTPTGGSSQLVHTNLTGNPSVIIPHGFREAPPLSNQAARRDSTRAAADTGRQAQPAQPSPRPETPVSLTFLGPLFQEEKPLALAHAFQKATGFHTRKPPGFAG
jgi:Asp-tRNA(Asn)/Glu-tRNA(Gln) amidotransferase A subunit family amidase